MDKTPTTLQIIKEDISAAFMLLTRIPMGRLRASPETTPDLNRCLWAYPLVGMVVSLIGAFIYWGATELSIPQTPAIILSLAAIIFTTGAFHEDGLADVADGFGGGTTRENKLEIMRDSRIGTYGGLALIISIGLKITSLATLPASYLMIALIIGAMISRFMIIVALLLLSPARKESLSVEAGKPSVHSLLVAAIMSTTPAIMFVGLRTTFIAFAVAAIATAILCRIAYKQVGGFSGDILGAVQQLSEISIFIALAALWGSQ